MAGTCFKVLGSGNIALFEVDLVGKDIIIIIFAFFLTVLIVSYLLGENSTEC